MHRDDGSPRRSLACSMMKLGGGDNTFHPRHGCDLCIPQPDCIIGTSSICWIVCSTAKSVKMTMMNKPLLTVAATSCLLLLLGGSDAFVQVVPRSQTCPVSTATTLFHNKKKKGTKKSGGGKGFAASSSTAKAPAKVMDRFPYAGALRPGVQTPQKIVTVQEILQPDYAASGIPQRVDKPMFPWMIEVKNAHDIEKMRAAGSLARDILDLAGQAVEVGVSTDDIDQIVHNEIIKVRNTRTSQAICEKDRKRKRAPKGFSWCLSKQGDRLINYTRPRMCTSKNHKENGETDNNKAIFDNRKKISYQ